MFAGSFVNKKICSEGRSIVRTCIRAKRKASLRIKGLKAVKAAGKMFSVFQKKLLFALFS